jgi:ornithine cyclodeaminase/alanine dehydrogenase-like protein (mu-crystallin family)
MLTATDERVRAVSAADAVELMLQAVKAHGAGTLCAPPRMSIDLGEAQLTFTAGRMPGVATGFRLYCTAPEGPEELTLVALAGDGGLGMVLGKDLGRRRTGALGGVAAKLCARAGAESIGLVGAGEQAFTQLWAIAAVRDLRSVRVFSRSAETAYQFGLRAKDELGLSVEVTNSAHDAVIDADIVVLSTPSPDPLIDVSWLAAGSHVHTLGPKGLPEGECPRELVRRAGLLVSDSPAQLTAMQGPTQPWTEGRRALSLGDIALGNQAGRSDDAAITLYASVGLAGTEVLLANHILNTPEA